MIRLGIGGRDKLYLLLIQRINQVDKADRLVAVFRAELGNADDQHRVIMAGNGEIIGRAKRLPAQPGKAENGDALQRFGHMQEAATGQRQFGGGHMLAIFGRIVGHPKEGRRQRSGGFGAIGHMPSLRSGKPGQAIIGGPIQRHDVQPGFDQVDERQKQVPIETILVEITGRTVAGGHHRHAPLQQGGE